MWQFLELLENSSFSTWVRETPSVLAYPTILAIHAFGMAFLVGFSTMISLRVLGYTANLPLAPMAKLYRFVYFGFWLAAISGFVLLVQAATTFTVMPIFWVKLLAIASAVLIVRKIRATVFGAQANHRPVPSEARTLASLLLALWGIAILAGRLTAYAFSPIGWQSTIAVLIAVTLVLVALRVGAQLLPEKPARQQAKVRTSTGY
jgi:hypothetical protein